MVLREKGFSRAGRTLLLPVLLAGLLGLSGCVDPATGPAATPVAEKVEKIPEEVLQYALDLGMALQIVKECRKGLTLNVAYAQGMQAAFEKKYGKNPAWANTDGLKQLGDKRLQDYALDYVSRRNVVIVQPATWCAAGRADIAAGTRIGKLLIAQ